MIWITGDKHGQIEPFLKNPAYKKIKKNDTLLICGDFGFLWDESGEEIKNLKWLAKRKFKIAFVEGCHDNQQILSKYPLTNWNGGRARLIFENIIHLINGEFYRIEDKKVLAFGGGFSDNMGQLTQNDEYLLQKVSLTSQIDTLVENIKKANQSFDIIISHEAPKSIAPCLETNEFHCNFINNILEEIRTHAKFQDWFFGKYHVDRIIPPKYHAVFNDVLKFEIEKWLTFKPTKTLISSMPYKNNYIELSSMYNIRNQADF